MNKKELNELKRQIKWDNDLLYIPRIASAYASISAEEKKVLSYEIKDFSLMSEEEGTLYLNIMKKSLAGHLGKNLLQLKFPRENGQPNPAQEQLYALVGSKLEDEQMFRSYVEELLEKGHYTNHVFILAAYCEYSVPLKSKNLEASYEDGYKYDFILISAVPAVQTNIGLYYNRDTNEVERKVNSEMEIRPNPDDAILYPCFSERAADVNHVLYHAKNVKSLNPFLIEDVLGCTMSMSPLDEESGFSQMLIGMFEDRINAQVLTSIHENIYDSIAESEEDPSELTYSKSDVKKLLEFSGADEVSMSHFDEVYSKVLADQPLKAVNMTNLDKMAIKVPDVTIQVKNGGDTKVKMEMINGRKCLVIEMDDSIEINGIEMKP